MNPTDPDPEHWALLPLIFTATEHAAYMFQKAKIRIVQYCCEYNLLILHTGIIRTRFTIFVLAHVLQGDDEKIFVVCFKFFSTDQFITRFDSKSQK